MSTTNLPEELHSAYEWTAAAGELDILRDLSDRAAVRYCNESAANCCSNGDGSVSASDLRALRDWLRAQRPTTYEIQARNPHGVSASDRENWSTDYVGDNNVWTSREEAEAGIVSLREAAGSRDPHPLEYRVIEIL